MALNATINNGLRGNLGNRQRSDVPSRPGQQAHVSTRASRASVSQEAASRGTALADAREGSQAASPDSNNAIVDFFKAAGTTVGKAVGKAVVEAGKTMGDILTNSPVSDSNLNNDNIYMNGRPYQVQAQRAYQAVEAGKIVQGGRPSDAELNAILAMV